MLFTQKIKFLSVLIFFSYFASSSSVFGQRQILEGVITDTNTQAIPHTNIIATPYLEGQNIRFAISDLEGKYRLSLDTDLMYKIEVSSIGYSTLTDSLSINKNSVKDYQLAKSTTSLEEVVVKARMAMIVNQDTTIYRVDKFTTGSERKLRDVLEKIPGIEVDREGGVTINGKKVNKLMIDGQDFFGGDTKLGVNHIPANAIDEIEAIDNYNEVAFMKGLSDSEKLAMNIKLKKEVKDFVFGEIEAGGGLKNRYHLQPTLFYYSPNTTLNFIGSLNNINRSPLSSQDMMRFSGGFQNLTNQAVNFGSDNLMQFSSRADVKSKKTQFAATNFTQSINKNLRLEVYSILAKQEDESEIQTNMEYLTQESLREERNTNSKDRGLSNFNKMRLRYTPSLFKDLTYDLYANITNHNYANLLKSNVADSINKTQTQIDPHNTEINQYFRYSTQPSYKHTSEIRAEHSFRRKNQNSNWDYDKPLFSDIIPIIKDGESNDYHLFQENTSITNVGSINFKHYWVLSNTTHLYPIAGFYFLNQKYTTTDYQILDSGIVNDFNTAGFNNDITYQLLNPYLGFQYKFKAGDFILRPGLVYHYYSWKVNQFQEENTEKSKGVFLPEFKLEYKPNTSVSFEFKYNLNSSFAEVEKYANRLSLGSFNQLYQGNQDIENSLYHSFSLYYRKIDMLRSMNYNLIANYTRREKSIQNNTEIEGIDQINTVVYSNLPENNLSLTGRLHKRWTRLALSMTTQASFSDYSRILNQEKLNYDSQNLGYQINLLTYYSKLPNISFGFTHNISWMQAKNRNSQYTSIGPSASLDYIFLKDFAFKMRYAYSHTKYKNDGNSMNFQIASSSLFYRGQGKAWGLELRVDNLFDVAYKRNTSMNQYMLYEQHTYLQPRTALIILSFRL